MEHQPRRMPTVDQEYERIERSRQRGLPRPTPPQPQPAPRMLSVDRMPSNPPPRMLSVDRVYERIERSRQRGLPRPTSPQPQPATPLQGVAAALGQATRTLQSTLQRAGQTIASGARTIARRAGEFAAWAERQSEELFRGKVTPTTVIGTAASFVLPTTIMQIAGGQKKADIRNPETAIGLGSDILSMIPVAGAVAKAVRAGSTAARAAGSAARAARVAEAARTAARPAAEAPAVARLIPVLTLLELTLPSIYI